MHLVICRKGANTIERVVKDIETVIESGLFIEINSRNGGGEVIRAALVDLYYTQNAVEPVMDEKARAIGWDKKASDLAPCPTLDGLPVGSREDINRVTVSRIARDYPLASEIKALRQAVSCLAKATGVDPGEEFSLYNGKVEALVAEGRALKDEHFRAG